MKLEYPDGATPLNPDELGVRFHHRLVFIHPFNNGNGRLSRIATDLLFHYNGHRLFTWGAQDLITASDVRQNYISALKRADIGDYSPLLNFVRS